MSNTIIGRVLATEKNPTTIDDFTFWTDPELILNPFDIVKVQHVNDSYSYGVIEDIAHITDSASFLTNYISSDFGDVNVEEKWYGIQIMGLGRKLEAGDPALKGLKVESVKASDSNVYKYITARSQTREAASLKLADVRKKFPEAFIVEVEGDTVRRPK